MAQKEVAKPDTQPKKAAKQQDEQEEKEVKVVEPSDKKAPAAKANKKDEVLNVDGGNLDDKAIMVTGATHARELLSMQVPLFLCLKLIHQGILQDKPKYQQMLAQSKFHFIPTINVDGAVFVEDHWKEEHQILNKRKNMNPATDGICTPENSGVDLNRNYGVDWTALNQKNASELCGDFWPGTGAFSEPETRALRDFVAANRNELKFIINCHTSGNEFIWPFNGREPNDIETRAPGYLSIFQDIAEHAPFPDGVLKGNSYEVIGDKMGGDADDYVLATFGVPSVTSEMGYFGQYIKDWRCQSKGVCFEILRENTRWIEYIFTNVPKIAQFVTPK